VCDAGTATSLVVATCLRGRRDQGDHRRGERLEKLVDEIENALREDTGELIHGHLHPSGNMLKATWG
jgi:hypothetical protein